jgi:magnesium transporter
MRKLKRYTNKNSLTFSQVYTGNHKEVKSEMQLFVYNKDNYKEYNNCNIDDVSSHTDNEKTNWLNLHGLNDTTLIHQIAAYFQIDAFIVSDILNTKRRTKLEEQHQILFFSIKSILYSDDEKIIPIEQISFVMKENFLISFQEKKNDFFGDIRERIRSNSGIIRSKNSDYLLFVLLDTVMENFYITIEKEEDLIEHLVDEIKINPNTIIIEKIEHHRDNFSALKRAIIPLRDSLYSIKSIRYDIVFNAIEKENFTFFARLHQKSLELLEQIDADMSLLESASNFYFSAQSQKMNEIMKTLTIISVVFIPLTFIVGVYGMNFDNMPELRYKYGYFITIAIMFLLVLFMVYYFKRRKWF